jgi:two-component system, NarL family, nitrate/nitrite response regulator NarL
VLVPAQEGKRCDAESIALPVVTTGVAAAPGPVVRSTEPFRPADGERIPPGAATRVRVVVLHHSEVIRRGLGSILSMLPAADVACYEQATSLAALAAAEFAEILIVPLEFGSQELIRVRESLAGSHTKVLVLLRDFDRGAVQRALAIHADGFLLESELTPATLDNALSRVLHGEVPMPAFLAREMMTRLRMQETKQARRPFLLTQRELQTLSLLVDGLTNRQIARRLGVSENGAKRHVASVLAKTNCPNRTVAVALVLREGLLDGE